MKRLGLFVAVAVAAAGLGGEAAARDELRVVASSSAVAYFEAVGERIVQAGFPQPKIQNVTTGDRRLKFFCGGVGTQYPDIVSLSKAMKKEQIEACKANGVVDFVEMKYGYDGIALIRKASLAGGQTLALTARHLWLAMAAQVPVNGALAANPYKLWSDIDPALPALPIRLFVGPEGTNSRQMVVDYATDKACMTDPTIAALPEGDREPACTSFRMDGAVTEFENSRQTVEALVEGDLDAIAVTAYGVFRRYGADVTAATLDGVAPTDKSVMEGDYPLARALYMAVKTANQEDVPGLREFVMEILGNEAQAPDGYLQQLGLLPLPPEERVNILQSFGS